jgi:phage host-nuclease inhibitor protein Gam
MGYVSQRYAEKALAVTQEQRRTLEALKERCQTAEDRALVQEALTHQANTALHISWAISPPKRY